MEATRAKVDAIIVDPLLGEIPQKPTPQSGVAALQVLAPQEP